MKKELLGLALSAALVAGCGEAVSDHPSTEVKTKDIYGSGQVVQVELGGSNFLKVVDPTSHAGKDMISNIPLVDHQYPHGSADSSAPTVNATPTRVNAQVTLQGKSPELANDAACETLRVEGQPKYIGAVALGGDANGVMISRPLDKPGFVYLCSFQDMEPKPDTGVVIFSSEQDR